MKRVSKIIATLLLLFILGGVIIFQIKITKVTVTGTRLYSQSEVEEAVFNESNCYRSAYFWLRTRFKGVPEMPFAQEIDVKWNSMSNVTLQVYDKTITGCVKYMGQYVFFDKDGIVLQSLPDQMKGVPVVSGINFGKFTINKAIAVKDKSLFNTILNLSQLIEHYKLDAKEVRFIGKSVTLYAGDIEVYLGTKDFYDDDVAALSSVLKTAKEKKLKGTINMEHYEYGNKIILEQPKDVTKSSKTKEK